MVNCTHNNNAANCQAQGVNPDQKSQLEGDDTHDKKRNQFSQLQTDRLCAVTGRRKHRSYRRGWSKKVGHVS